MTSGTEAATEFTAYIKGDSIIVMAIDTTTTAYDLRVKMPFKVKSGTHLLSTGNETENLCQEKPIAIEEPSSEVLVEMPARSLNTYIFMIDRGEDTIHDVQVADTNSSNGEAFDLMGRRVDASELQSAHPVSGKGIYIRNGKKYRSK